MKVKKRTVKRLQSMLCMLLAVVGLFGLLPGEAVAADLGKISEISTEAEKLTEANLIEADLESDAKLNDLAKQLGTSVSCFRFVRIYYAGNTDNCVDIPGDRVHEEGTPGILYEAHFANPNQIFILRLVGNGVYQIICLESGKLLEVQNSSKQDCAKIVQSTIHDHPNGMWKLIQNKDGTVSFKNLATNGMLNARGGRADARELIQFHADSTMGEKFYVKDVTEDEVLCAIDSRFVRILYAINPAKCVDVPAEGILTNGMQLQLWDRYYGNQNQIYVMEKTGFGWTIKNYASQKFVEVRNSYQNGAQVAQWDPHDSACARWDILANMDGSVSFRNRESGKYLNLCGGGIGKNGQKFIQYFDDNSESMRFKIVVMGMEDVHYAVYERDITNSDINWTRKDPKGLFYNGTEWNREGYYPTFDQRVLVSVEFLDPTTVTKMLKNYAYSPTLRDQIEAIVNGEASEEAISYVLKQLGLDIPVVGTAMGVLQAVLNLQDDEERNRFVDAVSTDNPRERSGVIIYTYKTVYKSLFGVKVNGKWKPCWGAKTKTEVEYGSWTGTNFSDVYNLRLNGTTGTWHFSFK